MMKKLPNLALSFFALILGGVNVTTSALETTHESTQAKSMVIEESNFQQLSQEMEQKSLGLLLMFHAEHCPYCALMEKDILSPMLKSGEYTDKVIIRKLQLDESRDIKNFKGEIVQPSDIAARYDVTVTPTLVFLDKDGNQKAKKMVGINTVDYFGVYLDEEIENLRKNLKNH
jgi:thioredoxin-related protein